MTDLNPPHLRSFEASVLTGDATPEDLDTLRKRSSVYVYESPVRLWHWVNALAITVLAVAGYGNCRVTATALAQVWRVQFYNSMETLILDTFEVTEMPEVALAATEDLADSAVRIRDVIEAVR